MDTLILRYPLLLIIVLIVCSSCQEQQKTAERISRDYQSLNLFLFLADDLSLSDLGINGNKYVNSKNIDAFAEQSISFNQMYTPTAMCAPSRSAMMTGLYPHRNGCHMNHGAIHSDIRTLPQYLIPLGYKVVLVGKRHIRPIESFPYDFINTVELDSYLESHEGPFCVIYASNDPHGPHLMGAHDPDQVIIPNKWVDTKGTREKLAGYYADIAELDNEFQSFLNSISNHNLDENSITIFTSDHGADFYAKWSCYEAGLKIPFYLQTNGVDFPAKEINQLTSFVDILPTFVELAGGQIDEPLDGHSMLNILNGSEEEIHEYIYGAHTTRGIFSGKTYPIRSITNGTWKYIWNLNAEEAFQNIMTNGWNFDPPTEVGLWSEWLSIKNQNLPGSEWVNFYQNRPEHELYYLSDDPSEIKNLAFEPLHSHILNQLKSELQSWMEEQNDTGMAAELKVPLKARDMSKVPTE